MSRQYYYLKKVSEALVEEINALEIEASCSGKTKEDQEVCHRAIMIIHNIKNQIDYGLQAMPKPPVI